jgi:hypothetical protein
MFDFLRTRGVRRPAGAIQHALEADGLPPGTDLAELAIARSPGVYAGRDGSFFRVFDPERAARRAVDVLAAHAYQDLNAHPDLVLRSGFLAPDGAVVVFTRPTEAGRADGPVAT